MSGFHNPPPPKDPTSFMDGPQLKKYTYVQPKSLAAKIAFVNFGSKGKPAICLPTSVKLILVKKQKSGSISVLIAPKSSNCLKAPSTDSLGGGSKKSNFSNFVIPIKVKKTHNYYLWP